MPAVARVTISAKSSIWRFPAVVISGRLVPACWSELGTRPRFKIVTGVSTGALIAPFAFVGEAYDERLKEVYTTQGIGDLYRIYLISQNEGVDYNLAYVGADFDAEHKEEFDTEFMRALFDYGYQVGRGVKTGRRGRPAIGVSSRFLRLSV